MAMVVPVLLPVAVPRFLTKAMPARASDAARPSRRASASVATARGAGSRVIAPEGGGWRGSESSCLPQGSPNEGPGGSGKSRRVGPAKGRDDSASSRGLHGHLQSEGHREGTVYKSH